MDAKRWERIQELFDAALDIAARDERDAVLRRECGDDDELLDEVQALLDADTREHSILDGVAVDAIDITGEFSLAGKQVGNYRVIERIASGGMGAVYLAERADGTFDQKVALKLIKRGMDSEEILRRFQAERQILARLEHPNIARLLDGGMTDDGLPYFTMEYVDGVPIDEYCDRERLSIDERIELFVTVLDVVQYAQRNLVVHRDLKPSNIMVGADGDIKLLDFGIAKLVDDDDAAGGLTRTGHRMMTPGYASPEQVRGEPVTTATDVYALGVILYELLSGQRPYAVDESTPAELERAIVSTLPERPSTALYRQTTLSPPASSRPTTTADQVSASRRTAPDVLRRKLRGDLDNICLMALRKEPERRYSSAEQFLLDVERYRRGRPLIARVDTAGYRVQKFVQRNVAGVITAGVVVALVSALITFYTVQLTSERDRARLEAQKAETVSEFLISLFQVADPNESPGETVTARELLDQGASRIESELAVQPEVQAQMLQVVGRVYFNLGLFSEAGELLKKALTLRSGLFGRRHQDTIQSMSSVAEVTSHVGDFEKAEEMFREIVPLARETLGDYHFVLGEALNSLAIVLNETGRYAEAESLYSEAIRIYLHDATHDDSVRVAITLNNVALLQNETGRYETSRQTFEQALTMQRGIFGEVHPEIATTLYNYAQLLRAMGDYARAEEIAIQGLEMDRLVFGPEHPDVAYSMVNVAVLMQRRGDYLGAKPLLEEALELRMRKLGPEHPNTGFSLNHVARLHHELCNYDVAESLYVLSLNIHKKINGPTHRSVAQRINNLGWIAYDRGDYVLAERYHREAYDVNVQAVGEDGPPIAVNKIQIANALRGQGRYEEAERYAREALALVRSGRGEDHPYVASSLLCLTNVLRESGDYDGAEAACRQALDVLNKRFDEDHLSVIGAENSLARVLERKGELDEAERLFRRALEIRSERLPDGHRRIAESLIGLGTVLCARGDARAAEEALRKGTAMLARIVGDEHPQVVEARAAREECVISTEGSAR